MPAICVWGEDRNKLWTPDGFLSVPKHYEYLEAGDAALTRAVKRAIGRKRLYVVMKKVHKRYPSKRVGLWAPAALIGQERNRLLALRTTEHKALLEKQKERKQAREILAFRAEILEQFPGCPTDEAQKIAEHACEVGSGRVGRSTTADDPVHAAVVAHIRHTHTDYDEILDSAIKGWMDYEERQDARSDARDQVRELIDEILSKWGGSTKTTTLESRSCCEQSSTVHLITHSSTMKGN